MQPLTDLLRQRLCFQRLFTPDSPMSPVWLAEIARLLPEVRAGRPDLPPPANLPPDEERHHLFEALAQCVLSASDGPIVLFIDDAHWADSSTLDWLSYLLNRAHDRALLLALAYRPEEAGADLTRLVADRAASRVRIPGCGVYHRSNGSR